MNETLSCESRGTVDGTPVRQSAEMNGGVAGEKMTDDRKLNAELQLGN